MAYIYQKQLQGTVSGYDQCLILNPKESILYPLPNELKDWKEIRIGFNMTLTSGENPNAQAFAYPGLFKTNTAYGDSFYFGLKTNNNLLPFQNGCAFIGLGHRTGVNTTVGSLNNDINGATYFNVESEGTISFLMGSGEEFKNYKEFNSAPYANTAITNGLGIFSPVNSMVGSGEPFMPFVLRIIKQNNSYLMSQARSHSQGLVSTKTNDNSITGLRHFMNMFGYSADYTYFQRSYPTNYFPFTSDLTLTGVPVPTPDALFIYWPYGNTKLRVHNFCVEKYA